MRHRAIVGDPQADGGPNPELVEAYGPIRVTPLRDLPGHRARAAWAGLPHDAYGSDDDEEASDEGDDDDEADDENEDDTPEPASGGDSTTGVDEDYFDSIDASTVPPAPPKVAGNTNWPGSTLSLPGYDADAFGDAPKMGPIPGDDFPPPLARPDFHTDANSYLQPVAGDAPPSTVKDQQSTVTGAPNPNSPSPSPQWSDVNAQRNAAHPNLYPSLAPNVNPGATLEQVMQYWQSTGKTPEQTADAVKLWRRLALDRADRLAQGQGYFAAATQVDRDTQNALDTLRQFSDNSDDEANPIFSVPQQSAEAQPIYGSDGKPLAYYQPRVLENGSLRMLMTAPDQVNGGSHHSVVNVPAVTDADISAAQGQANEQAKQLSKWASELEAKAASSGPVLGDDGTNDLVNYRAARMARQNALDAEAYATRLSDSGRARSMLTAERASEALRQSPLANMVGRSGVGPVLENFARTVDGFVGRTYAMMDDALGHTAARDRDLQEVQDIEEMLPGDTGPQWYGGPRSWPGKASTFYGNMAPAIMASPIPGGSTAAMSLQGAVDAHSSALGWANELDNRAKDMRGLGRPDLATPYATQAQEVRDGRFGYAASNAAVNALASRVLPKLPDGANVFQKAVRSGAENTLIATAQGQALTPQYLGESQRMSLGDTVDQGVTGSVLGPLHEKLGQYRVPWGKGGLIPPLATRSSAPSFAAPEPITVDGADASFHSAGGDFQGEIPPPAPGGPNAHLAIPNSSDGSGAGSGEAVPPAPLKTEDGSSDVYAKPLTPSGSADSNAPASAHEGVPSGNPPVPPHSGDEPEDTVPMVPPDALPPQEANPKSQLTPGERIEPPARSTDPRIRERFGDNFEPDEYGLPQPPHKLEDGDKLLQSTDKLKEANIPEDHPLVKEGLLRSGPVSREEFREAAIQHFLNQATKLGPDETPQITITGGGGGAGKSDILQLLRDSGELNDAGAVQVNSDDLKDLIPEYKSLQNLGDGRAAEVTQKESTNMANELLRRATDPSSPDRYNVVFDSTLSRGSKDKDLIDQWKESKFKTRLIGVTIDPQEAMIRAALRGDKSGRWVPNSVLDGAHARFNQYAKRNLGLVDEGVLYDNTGTTPTKIATAKDGNIVVVKPEEYAKVDQRGGGNP